MSRRIREGTVVVIDPAGSVKGAEPFTQYVVLEVDKKRGAKVIMTPGTPAFWAPFDTLVVPEA